MKRCFSMALILALLTATVSSPALAEDAEVVSAFVEAEVAPAQSAGDTGLTVDGEIPEATENEALYALSPETPVDGDAAIQAEPDAAQEVTGLEDANAAPEEAPKAAVTVQLNRTDITIGVGEKYKGLYARALPEGSPLPKLSWSSDNKKVAKVGARTGTITGVAAGECTVSAKLPGGQTLSCRVTVAKKPGSVSLSKSALTLTEGMNARLTAKLPEGCASGVLTFKSNKSKYVTVDEDGNIVAQKKGTATITVSTYNGKTATCKVTVKKAPAAVTFAAEAVSVAVGQKASLKATARTASGGSTPADIVYAIDQTSPDAGCVRLNASKGTIKGLRKGTAIITATTHNGIMAVCTVTVDAAPAAVTLNLTEATIGTGEKFTLLSAALTPPEGSATCASGLTWSSSNKSVAKVNAATGAVTGVKAGTATITVKAAGGKTAACRVTVAAKPDSVTLSRKTLTLTVGMKAQLTASVPQGSASGALTFESSKAKYVSVDGSGNLAALKKGTAIITVSTYNGKTATCKVTVKKAPSGLTFAADSVSIAMDQTIQLKATARTGAGSSTPANIVYAIDQTSADAGCIQLDPATGDVKGLRKGSAIVTATTHNGLMAVCAITVDAAPKSVALNSSSGTLGVGETYDKLSAVLTPPDGSATCASHVTWSTSDKSVVKVDASTGAITGVKTGAATITVTAAGGKTATCKVTVKKAPTSLEVKPTVGALKVGQTGQYQIIRYPEDSGGRVYYASSDEAIASVDENGYVTANAVGNVTITVSTYNGLSQKVSLEVYEDDEGGGNDDGSDGDGGKTSAENAKKLEYVISMAMSQLGKPYVYGSGYTSDSNPRGFDCSGLMYWCFLRIDIRLKDTAYRQGYDDSMQKITNKNALRRGDLVFFNTVNDSDLSDHSALYLGDGKFIHASSSAAKVVISDMSKSGSYYDRVFSWGRRVLD